MPEYHATSMTYFAAANVIHALLCGHFVNMDQDHTHARIIPNLTEKESPPECKDCLGWVGGRWVG